MLRSMSRSISRRDILGIAAMAGASSIVVERAQAADAFPKIDEKDPQAVALGYLHDATKVDPKKNPTWKAGQFCHNCMQVTGKDGEAWRPCNLFPRKLVAADGWCRVWVKKPGA